MPDRTPDSHRSLAAASAGERLRIVRILWAGLRDQCRALGIREGDVALCRMSGPAHVWLDTASGRSVPIDLDAARFIRVSDVPPAASGLDGQEAGAPLVSSRG